MLLRDDARLLERFRLGDAEVLAAIYRHYRAQIERLLSGGFAFQSQGSLRQFRGFDSRADLDDAVAETFRKALGPTARKNYDPRAASFERYLTTIARNQAIGHLRRSQREKTWSQTLIQSSCVTQLSGVTPAPLMSPEDEAHLAQVRQSLALALDALAPEDRRHVELLLEGRSQREIASLLGVGRGEVRQDIYRLRRQVERALEVAGVPPTEVLRWLDARGGQSRASGFSMDWRSGSWVTEGGRGSRPLELPARFGSYLLIEKIGEGGMAEVFKAKKIGVEGFERFVAVKLMKPEVARRQAFVSMFIDEAKLAARITHRSIGQIFELGRHEGVYFMAMEYIEGQDLQALWTALRRLRRPPNLFMACYIAAEIAEALDYAHSRFDVAGRPLSVVHQDVSPRNVLIGAKGEVKVIDFGLAKAAIQSSSSPQAGLRRGTLRTMSPEQLRGQDVDGRSDIFSLGVLLYELLTLERLFTGQGDTESLLAERAEVLPPSVTHPEISPEIDAIVLRALAPDPADRYQEAGALADALRQLARAHEVHFGAKELAAEVLNLSTSSF